MDLQQKVQESTAREDSVSFHVVGPQVFSPHEDPKYLLLIIESHQANHNIALG
jgi:hypothetical protein